LGNIENNLEIIEKSMKNNQNSSEEFNGDYTLCVLILVIAFLFLEALCFMFFGNNPVWVIASTAVLVVAFCLWYIWNLFKITE
jgi:hypothetical protein